MKLAWLLKKIPFRLLAGSIITLIGLLILGIYLLVRPSPTRSPAASSPTHPTMLPAGINWENTIVAGNTLLNLDGTIIAPTWLQDLGNSSPNIAAIRSFQKLLILKGSGGYYAFSFEGKQMPLLSFDGKPVGAAAFDRDFNHMVFQKEGNLWKANVDWISGSLSEVRKVTEVDFFRQDVLKSNWVWVQDKLIVPHLMQTLEIDLNLGSVKEIPLPVSRLEKSVSPDGSFAAVPLNSRTLAIADFMTGESQQFTFKFPFRNTLWLSATKLIIQTGLSDLALYDHKTKQLVSQPSARTPIGALAVPSPKGDACAIATGGGIFLLETDSGKLTELPMLSELAWVSDSELIGSSSAIDTDLRGMWLVSRDGTKEKISSLPCDGGPAAILRTEGGAAFVSRSDLWIFDKASKAVRQVTHGAGLQPILQAPFALSDALTSN